ncbi:hypothetical protein FGO68_gene8156 [Halteria grandinella]|uniref:Uncharacterized protein n=1 Tax=Halteria grandinella TaxID=5974 RepID=A0A8J8NF86_HALGN|nr:hypothetical protein FGO68_gene8156 [Halteria grandinella]
MKKNAYVRSQTLETWICHEQSSIFSGIDKNLSLQRLQCHQNQQLSPSHYIKETLKVTKIVIKTLIFSKSDIPFSVLLLSMNQDHSGGMPRPDQRTR